MLKKKKEKQKEIIESPWRNVGRRILKNKTALLGISIVTVLIIIAIFAPYIAPYDPVKINIIHRLSPPSETHLFGTDRLGRDILSRIIYGTRITLQVGIITVTIALIFGIILGTAAGYYGGIIDNILSRIIDIMLSFPYILLALVVVAILGPGLYNAMVAIGIVNIPRFARIVRSAAITVRKNEYITAARALGNRDWKVIIYHLLPNCMAPIIVQATISIASAILNAAALSFLGLGAQPPTPEWGAMLSDGRTVLQTAPWVVIFPGLAIMISVLGFNIFGDGLRDVLDPKSQNQRFS